MTADDFRRIALSLPETLESAHHEHADFRVGKKIFATLGYPDDSWAMVKLTPEQQSQFVQASSGSFRPVKGGWGARGATSIRLDAAGETTVRHAAATAWCNVAPRRLIAEREIKR